MMQRLIFTLVQIKPDNTFGNLFNEIGQIVYSLYRTKKITKKVYRKMMKAK